jgi:branched-chain amino acid transport system substrate-binding protein
LTRLLRSASRPLASASAALLLAGLAACGPDARERTFVLGLAAPLERPFGEASSMGAKLAVREINGRGGVRGRLLELREVDDRSDEGTAIAVADSLYRDVEVLAVVGHASSGPMAAASTVYNRGLPAVGTSATSTEIGALGEWIFRIASSDSANAAALAVAVSRMGRRAAILYANDDYGRSLANVFEQALRATETPLVGRYPYLEEMEDFTPYVRVLQARGADVVLVAGLEIGAATLIEQAHRSGWRPRFVGGDGLEPLVEMGESFDGTLLGVLFHPAMSTLAQGFAERFRAAFGREPDSSAATSYDAVYLIARALEAGRTSRQAIRDYLATVGRPGGTPALEGVAGPVRFDENGDPMEKPVALVRIQDGAFVLAATR